MVRRLGEPRSGVGDQQLQAASRRGRVGRFGRNSASSRPTGAFGRRSGRGRRPSVTDATFSPRFPARRVNAATPSAPPAGRACAFSIAPETSEAMWTSSFNVSSVNSRGRLGVEHDHGRACRPKRAKDRDGDHRLEALPPRAAGRTSFRGSSIACSRMNSRRAVAERPSRSETLLDRQLHGGRRRPRNTCEGRPGSSAARPSSRVDEAGVAIRRLGCQIDDPLEHRRKLDRPRRRA